MVVIGFDMTLTYEKLERACTYIRNGAVFWQRIWYQLPDEGWFLSRTAQCFAAISLSTGRPVCRKTIQGDRGYGSGDDREQSAAMSFVGDRIYADVKTVVNGHTESGADRRDEAGGCTEGGCRAGCDFHQG